eukprot:CAMPEP_0172529976 /NCGR_PEP_ID=MMETSP1067-20121228/3879_1 /TAXON_ID=265564 ORGANISM="Thalassiosira punctigera, Strain Tpunct2005C2" /NCGR_SAMPLE_ID=MMETSP1067 /ASSEMBLY_ACC=CAM_ASM_000444 /LENGTH=170 /DNA_ID=CAMNT_0013314115 /DNA_START=81 /DNA_END=593 /DNA_ORIENTATION=-
MTIKRCLIASILWICLFCRGGSAFLAPKHHRRAVTPASTVRLSAHPGDGSESASFATRREWTKNAISSLVATGSVAVLGRSRPAAANDGDTIWKTGRAPVVPGQKPKDKGDVKGTKKDPGFLRSISDCRSKCENSPGPDGLAKTSAECLAECQDICCTTYEQCTFAIVPR